MGFVLPSAVKRGVALQRGEGHEGIVYEVLGHPELLLKIFKKEPTDERRRRLDRIVAGRPAGAESCIAWPLKIERNEGQTGILLPRVKDSRPIHQLYDTDDRQKFFPNATWQSIVTVAAGLAQAFSIVHVAGFVVADTSESNVLLAPSLRPFLIDGDSFVPQNAGTDSITTIRTPLWLAPELNGCADRTERTPDHDNFSLAIHIFLLLSLGRLPLAAPPGQDSGSTSERVFAYSLDRPVRAARPEELTLNDLPEYVAQLFERAFLPRSRNSPPRPTARAWSDALTRMAGAMRQCAVTRSHWHVSGLACPWCTIAARIPDGDPFPPNTVSPAAPRIGWRQQAALAACVGVAVVWFGWRATTLPPPPPPPRHETPTGQLSPPPRNTNPGAFPPQSQLRVLQRSDIAEAQRQLTNMGFDTGSIDGTPGARSQEALQAYSIARGEPESSVFTIGIVDALKAGPVPAAASRAVALIELGNRAFQRRDSVTALRLAEASRRILPLPAALLLLGDIANLDNNLDLARINWRSALEQGRGTFVGSAAAQRLSSLSAPPAKPQTGYVARHQPYQTSMPQRGVPASPGVPPAAPSVSGGAAQDAARDALIRSWSQNK